MLLLLIWLVQTVLVATVAAHNDIMILQANTEDGISPAEEVGGIFGAESSPPQSLEADSSMMATGLSRAARPVLPIASKIAKRRRRSDWDRQQRQKRNARRGGAGIATELETEHRRSTEERMLSEMRDVGVQRFSQWFQRYVLGYNIIETASSAAVARPGKNDDSASASAANSAAERGFDLLYNLHIVPAASGSAGGNELARRGAVAIFQNGKQILRDLTQVSAAFSDEPAPTPSEGQSSPADLVSDSGQTSLAKCSICQDPIPLSSFKMKCESDHNTCMDCLSTYFVYMLDKEGAHQFQCPGRHVTNDRLKGAAATRMGKCEAQVPPRVAALMMSGYFSNDRKSGSRTAIEDVAMQFVQRIYINEMKSSGWVQCPSRKSCDFILPREDLQRRFAVFPCGKCNMRRCMRCGKPVVDSILHNKSNAVKSETRSASEATPHKDEHSRCRCGDAHLEEISDPLSLVNSVNKQWARGGGSGSGSESNDRVVPCPRCARLLQREGPGCNKLKCLCGTVLCFGCGGTIATPNTPYAAQKSAERDHFTSGKCKMFNTAAHAAEAAQDRDAEWDTYVRRLNGKENPREPFESKLALAASLGDTRIVSRMLCIAKQLDKCVDAEQLRDKNGDTILHIAVENDNSELIRLMQIYVEDGTIRIPGLTDPNISHMNEIQKLPNALGEPALLTALRLRLFNIAYSLIGINVRAKYHRSDPWYTWTTARGKMPALHYAIATAQFTLATMLIRKHIPHVAYVRVNDNKETAEQAVESDKPQDQSRSSTRVENELLVLSGKNKVDNCRLKIIEPVISKSIFNTGSTPAGLKTYAILPCDVRTASGNTMLHTAAEVWPPSLAQVKTMQALFKNAGCDLTAVNAHGEDVLQIAQRLQNMLVYRWADEALQSKRKSSR